MVRRTSLPPRPTHPSWKPSRTHEPVQRDMRRRPPGTADVLRLCEGRTGVSHNACHRAHLARTPVDESWTSTHRRLSVRRRPHAPGVTHRPRSSERRIPRVVARSRSSPPLWESTCSLRRPRSATRSVTSSATVHTTSPNGEGHSSRQKSMRSRRSPRRWNRLFARPGVGCCAKAGREPGRSGDTGGVTRMCETRLASREYRVVERLLAPCSRKIGVDIPTSRPPH